MSHAHRQTKRSNRRWARFVLFGSVLGGALSVTPASTWGQSPASSPPLVRPAGGLSLPPMPTYGPHTPGRSPQAVPLPGTSKPAPNTLTTARLQNYDVPSQLVGMVGAQLQVHYHEHPSVRVTTDPQSGQLMIMAPDAVHREIGMQLANFMRQNNIPAGDHGVNLASHKEQSIALQNLSWRELEDALLRLAGDRLTSTTERNGELANLKITNSAGLQDILQIDRRQNRVTLLGTGATVAGWTQV
ncbi:MAG: hypothetical protein KDA45_05485, partial [Planctomycetales bacterium]|nr:hypothetical protein [Planctomycetales bacterium]